MRIFICGGTIVTPADTLTDYTLVLEGGTIASIEPRNLLPGRGERRLEARGLWVIPGLIDIHIHGSAGHDMMDATAEALEAMSRF
ncbi:MAG: hypothetical protein ACUVT2_11530, partial [Thiobacillaceae bacterium]